MAVLPGAAAPFHGGKWFLVLTLVPLGLFWSLLTGTIRFPHARWFVAWLTVSALASILGVAPWMSLTGSPNRNAGLLAMLAATGAFVLGASTGEEAGVQRAVLRAAIVGGGLVGVFGIVEWAGIDLFDIGDLDTATRARSTWGSATFAAAHIVLVGPITITHLRSRDRSWRSIAAAATAVMTLTLLLTGTRGAWIGAVAAAIVMVPAWVRSGRRERVVLVGTRSSRRSTGIVVVLAVLTVVTTLLAIPSLTRASGIGRVDLWRTTTTVMAERPILGSGPDTQRVVLPSGTSPEFEAAHGSSELHDRAHNIVLDTVITTGLVGLVALGGLITVVGLEIRRRLRPPADTDGDRPVRLVPTAIAAGLVGYLVTLFFAFSESTLDPIAWLLAGLLLAALRADDQGNSSLADGTRSDAVSKGIRSPGPRLAASVVLGLGAAGAGVWAGGEVLAEYRLTAALDALAANDTADALVQLRTASGTAPARFDLDQIAARAITRSIDEGVTVPIPNSDTRITGDTAVMADEMISYGLGLLDEAARVANDDTDVMMDRADLLTAVGRSDEALEAYDRILGLYPNSFRAHLGRGLAAINAGDEILAERSWKQAVPLGPRDPRALTNLGMLHRQRGDEIAATAFFEQALEVSPGDPAATAALDPAGTEPRD